MPPATASLNPLSLHVRRESSLLVGRQAELEAIGHELQTARRRLAAVTIEGEPGIGKTRLILAASELAAADGFRCLAATADEHIRGPFLLARSIFSAPAVTDAAAGTPAEEPLRRAVEALAGRDDPSLAGLPPDQKLLRTFDLAALALSDLAGEHPLALFVDDLQWADEDSVRLLRYVVRTIDSRPVFLFLALRPEETALLTEAVTLLADMERMGLVRRLPIGRFTQAETAEMLRRLLGGDVDASSAATVHAQSEGVPFILEELVRTYRDNGMVQQIDGVWRLARNAHRLLPSAVRTLIQRRAAHLPERTRTPLAEAAVLGRNFSLRDLADIKVRLGDDGWDVDRLAEALAPAVSAGLLVQRASEAAADYSFTHDSVRELASGELTQPRRRAIHAAIVQMLSSSGEPPDASLPLLAQHALAAGDSELAADFSVRAAESALAARAAEEALRLVDLALPVAMEPRERVALLSARDRALEMSRRPNDRLEGLSELAALADALGDSHLELEVTLRRAAALRLSQEPDRAAALAARVRDLAAQRGDREAELAACLELGQAMMRAELGDGYVPASSEVDLDGAEEAFTAAERLAEELGDLPRLAAATRELGVIDYARVRAWFVEGIYAGEHIPILQRVLAGETLTEILPELPIAPLVMRATARYERAIELFEQVGDRRGAMSAIIGLAYVNFGAEIHFGPTAAQRIEEIRKLATSMLSLTRESERLQAEAQMLYGVHVFCRAKCIPDIAVERGEAAWRQAREVGDRGLEFLAAGGTAMASLDLGDVGEAEQWLDRAAVAAAAVPTPVRARHLEGWRGLARAAALDAERAREHLQRAVQMATEQGRPAGRCETLATLALAMARLGEQLEDEGLLVVAERAAGQAKELAAMLPGHPLWGAQADAARAQASLATGKPELAVEAARAALATYKAAMMEEDPHLEIVLPVARALQAAGEDAEKQEIRGLLQMVLAQIAQRTMDEDVRVRWFRGPIGRELVRLAGPLDVAAAPDSGVASPSGGPLEGDADLLRLVAEGRTNEEIARALGCTEDQVVRRIGEMFARIGASSRTEATVIAVRQGVL